MRVCATKFKTINHQRFKKNHSMLGLITVQALDKKCLFLVLKQIDHLQSLQECNIQPLENSVIAICA